MSDTCKHMNFVANVAVNRLEDSGAFTADINICCKDCGEEFTFPPIPMGLSSHEMTVNLDGTELRTPIKPKSSNYFPAFAGFSVKGPRL